MVGQHEAEARALDRGLLGAEPIERREQPAHHLGRDAPTGVADAETNLLGADLRRHADGATRPVVLDGIRQEVQHDLLETLTIGQHVALERRHHDVDSLGGRLEPQHVEGGGHDLVDQDRLQGERQLSRLDPGDIEDLVDEVEQVTSALEDHLDALALLVALGLELEQLREADDAVQRGAQLVAHTREELALGPVGAVGVLFRPATLGDLLLELVVRCSTRCSSSSA